MDDDALVGNMIRIQTDYEGCLNTLVWLIKADNERLGRPFEEVHRHTITADSIGEDRVADLVRKAVDETLVDRDERYRASMAVSILSMLTRDSAESR